MKAKEPAVALIFLMPAAARAGAELDPLEAEYLKYSASLENMSPVDPNEILRTSMDLNGDGKPEELLSKPSLRDGKQGHKWTIYRRAAKGGKMERIGDVTVDLSCIAPAAWKKDPEVRGFYTYGPGGAGKGMLGFYAIVKGKLKELESREVRGAGAEVERLFGKFSERAVKHVAIPLEDEGAAGAPEQESGEASEGPTKAPQPK